MYNIYSHVKWILTDLVLSMRWTLQIAPIGFRYKGNFFHKYMERWCMSLNLCFIITWAGCLSIDDCIPFVQVLVYTCPAWCFQLQKILWNCYRCFTHTYTLCYAKTFKSWYHQGKNLICIIDPSFSFYFKKATCGGETIKIPQNRSRVLSGLTMMVF